MSDDRDPDLQTVAAAQAVLRDRGPLPLDELAGSLGLRETEVEDVLDFRDDTVLHLTDGRLVYAPALLEGRVFTHRLTEDEVVHDLLAVNPDLELVLSQPRADRRLVSGERLDLIFGDGPDSDSDQRAVPSEVVGPGGSIPLPVGTLAGLGVAADDLVALRITPDGVRLGRVDPAEVLDPGRLPELLTGLVDGSPVHVVTALLTLCVESPAAFRVPTVPVSAIIDRAGVAHDLDDLAPLGFDFAGYRDDITRRNLAYLYGLSLAQAGALMTLLRRLPGPGRIGAEDREVAAALRFLADPEVAEAVPHAASFRGVERAEVLIGFVDAVEGLAGRPSRPALLWLRAKAYAGQGRVLEAERVLEAAYRLDPDWPLVLLDLARYAGDRGDAVRGLSLLRRAEPYEDRHLERTLARFTPVPGPVVGRNEPCWCGSGRKFKQCHLHRSAEYPLSERVGWLYAKAAGTLTEWPWSTLVGQVAGEWEAPDEDAEHTGYGGGEQLILDAVLFEGGAFAAFLAARGDLLPADERQLAEQWQSVERGVHEVLAVRAGHGLTLRNLSTGEHHEVTEVSGSASLEPGDLVCARVVPAGDTIRMLGGPVLVPPTRRDELRALLAGRPGPMELVAFLGRRPAAPATEVSAEPAPGTR